MSESSSIVSRFKKLPVLAIVAIALSITLILGGLTGAAIYIGTKKATDRNLPDETSKTSKHLTPDESHKLLVNQIKADIAKFEGEVSAHKTQVLKGVDIKKIVDDYKAIEAKCRTMAEPDQSFSDFIAPDGPSEVLGFLEDPVNSNIDSLIEKSVEASPDKVTELKAEAEALVKLNISHKYDSSSKISELMDKKRSEESEKGILKKPKGVIHGLEGELGTKTREDGTEEEIKEPVKGKPVIPEKPVPETKGIIRESASLGKKFKKVVEEEEREESEESEEESEKESEKESERGESKAVNKESGTIEVQIKNVPETEVVEEEDEESEGEETVELILSLFLSSEEESEESEEESEEEGLVEPGPFKFPFSRFIPKEHRNYYEYHFSTDILIDSLLDQLISPMSIRLAKDFLLNFIPYLKGRIAQYFVKESGVKAPSAKDLEVKALRAALYNCKARLISLIWPEWLFPNLPLARSDDADNVFSEFSSYLSEIILEAKDEYILAVNDEQESVPDVVKIMTSLLLYYELKGKSVANLDDIFSGFSSYGLDVEFFKAAHMTMITAHSFMEAIIYLPDLLKDSPEFQVPELLNTGLKLFDITQPKVSQLLEFLVRLFLTSDAPEDKKDKALGMLYSFDKIYEMETVEKKSLYLFLKDRAILCSSKNDSIARLKKVQSTFKPGIASELVDYVDGLKFERPYGALLHPSKSEQGVLLEFISSGLNTGRDWIAEPRVMRLFNALLNVKITGDKLRKFDELRFSTFSRLLDSVIYPYAKKLNSAELTQIKGSLLSDKEPLASMLKPIPSLSGKVSALNLVYEKKVGEKPVDGIYSFHKSDAINSLDEPVKLVLCYLDALIEKLRSLLDFDPTTDPNVFDAPKQQLPPNVKYSAYRNPHYDNFLESIEVLQILGDKIFAKFSYSAPKDQKLTDYKMALDRLHTSNVLVDNIESYFSVAGDFLIDCVKNELDLPNLPKDKFPGLSGDLALYLVYPPRYFIQLHSKHLTGDEGLKNLNSLFDILTKSLVLHLVHKSFIDIKSLAKEIAYDDKEISRMKTQLTRPSILLAHLNALKESDTLPLTLVQGNYKPNLVPPITSDPYVLFVWNYSIKPQLESILKKARSEKDETCKKSFDEEIESIKKNFLLVAIKVAEAKYFYAEAIAIIRKIMHSFTYLIN